MLHVVRRAMPRSLHISHATRATTSRTSKPWSSSRQPAAGLKCGGTITVSLPLACRMRLCREHINKQRVQEPELACVQSDPDCPLLHPQDAVTRGGKFWKLYKRPGHRVIINADGDLIVRPTFIEANVQRRPGASSVAHHLLTSYLKSYVAVIKSQFSTKAFQGGREVRVL